MPTLDAERSMMGRSCRRVAGLDEVGRGALAGPVSVGAVVVTQHLGPVPDGLKDSKLLSAAARVALVGPIRAWAVECAVGHATAAEIDRIGIMRALRLAALRALAALSAPVDAVLLDGNVDYLSANYSVAQAMVVDRSAGLFEAGGVDGVSGSGTVCPNDSDDAAGVFAASGANGVILDSFHGSVVTRIKADRDCASVAAASVLAKVARDALMVDLHGRYAHFGWAGNKGYGTAEHLAAIARHGPCELHRRSWSLPARADGAAPTSPAG
ncbi:MAG: ribonuclease HII [Actinobacteria bacterium 69-20]|nr:MAG: ribonuclease HII [Actinobacteria bacterium 69-20]